MKQSYANTRVTVIQPGSTPPTITFTANSTSVKIGRSPVLNWTSANAISCVPSSENWSMDGNTTPNSGNTYGNITADALADVVPVTYTITCAGAGGSVSESVTVTVDLSASAFNAFAGLVQNNSASQTQTGFTYVWSNDLQIGSPYSADVKALQTALTKNGVYTGEITGGFYDQTYLAVKKFQQKYDINSTGYVGLQTRTKLNSLFSK